MLLRLYRLTRWITDGLTCEMYTSRFGTLWESFPALTFAAACSIVHAFVNMLASRTPFTMNIQT